MRRAPVARTRGGEGRPSRTAFSRYPAVSDGVERSGRGTPARETVTTRMDEGGR